MNQHEVTQMMLSTQPDPNAAAANPDTQSNGSQTKDGSQRPAQNADAEQPDNESENED